MKTFVAPLRYLAVIAVAGCALLAIGGYVYGSCSVIDLFAHGLHEGITGATRKHLTVEAIEIVDLYLLSTVFLITALGLFELFIDDRLAVPEWLSVRGLDDLKAALLKVVVVALAVKFLSDVVGWEGDPRIVYEGAAIALVVAAVTWFVAHETRGGH